MQSGSTAFIRQSTLAVRSAQFYLRVLCALSSCNCHEDRSRSPTSAQPSWPGMSRPAVVIRSRYRWAGTCPAMTVGQRAAGPIVVPARGLSVCAKIRASPCCHGRDEARQRQDPWACADGGADHRADASGQRSVLRWHRVGRSPPPRRGRTALVTGQMDRPMLRL